MQRELAARSWRSPVAQVDKLSFKQYKTKDGGGQNNNPMSEQAPAI